MFFVGNGSRYHHKTKGANTLRRLIALFFIYEISLTCQLIPIHTGQIIMAKKCFSISWSRDHFVDFQFSKKMFQRGILSFEPTAKKIIKTISNSKVILSFIGP